jgi:hypothetical protein
MMLGRFLRWLISKDGWVQLDRHTIVLTQYAQACTELEKLRAERACYQSIAEMRGAIIDRHGLRDHTLMVRESMEWAKLPETFTLPTLPPSGPSLVR